MRAPRHARRAARGFTLIEVIVALVLMAVMTVMAWRAVSALTGSRDHNEAAMDRAETLQTLMRQWELDLREVQDSTLVPALSFDGATLRLTRRRETGLQLVSWQLRDGRLSRWESPPASGRDALQDAWFRSHQLSPEELRALPGLGGVAGWQIYFFRGNGWSNAQSSGDLEPNSSKSGPSLGGQQSSAGPQSQSRVSVPTGVRLRLQFADDSGYRGELIREVPVESTGS
ncbi:MAG: prepilin-type N-terminal cleavage/methylation domain-containing protein [Mitsuaria chitosanitabida]|uniref:PulJ/GspJ family protein n=1 Tax=Roseateles chitosanitabidus TaxID=65048 RepID=UPI001B1C1687|nr:prepilin-type N-terminal cleavage/methylation domain-containing protein [Roseateles chitosanitabidus]MBO9686956.1 prepilin-type N-terminal cleavage/methylation domain-containing protein [Roseateles chitosanitabidus]